MKTKWGSWKLDTNLPYPTLEMTRGGLKGYEIELHKCQNAWEREEWVWHLYDSKRRSLFSMKDLHDLQRAFLDLMIAGKLPNVYQRKQG